MRKRLRPAYTEKELAEVYKEPHNHKVFPDHRLRVEMTIAFASWFKNTRIVADLSAGDASIINAIEADIRYIGDYAPAYDFVGLIDDTIEQIPNVDLFICSETIEHLDNPEATLAKIRAKTKYLIVTTPIGESDSNNPQHYWGWDEDGVRELLEGAGFHPVIHSTLGFSDPSYVYKYQLWGCS
jgi:hypothetical protein